MLPEKSPAVTAGLMVALLMIAGQVAGKATRDALFLTNFPVTALPAITVGAALASLCAVLLASRTMALYGPHRIIPLAFVASGLGLMGEWYLLSIAPHPASVLVYLHETVAGSILISGFWSIVNESFDPRSAKRCIAYFGCAGTAGGLAGCILAQWIASDFSIAAMIPILALMHFLCGWFVRRIRSSTSASLRVDEKNAAIAEESRAFGFAFRVLRQTSYARNLAFLILLSAGTAVLVNYVFKERAASLYQGDDLLRFFATFYTIASLLTFLVQSALSRAVLDRLGGARTVSILPMAVGTSAVFGVLVPGLPSAAIVGGIESITRNSLFRAGYETLYVPVSKRVKRSVKSIIDVGFDRLGSVAGAGAVQILLIFGSAVSGKLILAAAVMVSILALMVAIRLRHGYVDALERRLILYSGTDEPAEAGTDWNAAMDASELLEEVNPLEFAAVERGFVLTVVRPEQQPAIYRPQAGKEDSVSAQFVDLRSGDPAKVKAVLTDLELNPVLAPQVIQLLGWDAVSAEAIIALERITTSIEGLLRDRLLDQQNNPRIRGLIPRILASVPSQASVQALLKGLQDPQFEVRFHCGRALARIRGESPHVKIQPDVVYDALRTELEGGGFLVGPHTLTEKPEDSYLSEGIPAEQVDWRLEHAFMILSLVVAREPLRIAFRGLHSMEITVRGTAVEYLSSLLPGQIRATLLPVVERIARQS